MGLTKRIWQTTFIIASIYLILIISQGQGINFVAESAFTSTGVINTFLYIFAAILVSTYTIGVKGEVK